MATRLEEKITEILGSSVEKSVSLAFAIAPKDMKLRNAYSYNAVKKECGGWSGNCDCSNNPCMICSSAH